jgi:predicted PurR-regulated permease PerM
VNGWQALSPASRTLVLGACVVVVAAGMQAAATLVSSVVLAVILAAVLAPLQQRLERAGVPGWVSVVLVLTPVLALGALFLGFLAASLAELNARIPGYLTRLDALATSLSTRFLGGPDAITNLLQAAAPTPGQIAGWATVALTGTFQATNDLLLFLFIVLYAGLEAGRFPNRLRALLGATNPTVDRLGRLAHDLRAYVVINGLIGLFVAIVRTMLLMLLGVDFALLWGAWSLLLTYVPTVGYPLAVIPPTLLALVDNGLGTATLVFVAFAVINTLVYNVVQPKWAGESLNLSPFVVIVSLFFWGVVLGAMGALLAVPLTMMVRTLLDASPQTRWLAELMSDAVAPTTDPPRADDPSA